jgi:AmmeMemoRadiSam system protein B
MKFYKFVFVFCILFAVVSCSRKQNIVYLTWSSKNNTYPQYLLKPQESTLKSKDFPLCGTVSHHLLAGVYIDNWFKNLSSRRAVSNFIILSPGHWGLETWDWSLTDGSWQVENGLVKTNLEMLKGVKEKLNVGLNREAFKIEHGVEALIPFISNYFPEAKVLAIAYVGEPPFNPEKADILYQAIKPYLTNDSFLLISSDFSHHGNAELTAKRDLLSRKFFADPQKWLFAGCDNRPGMWILSKYFEDNQKMQMRLLHNTNSLELSGEDENDITSYFFSFGVLPEVADS